MLASELIKKLQAKIYEHGDLPVYLDAIFDPPALGVMKLGHKFIITDEEGL